MSASHKFTNMKRLLETPNRSSTEKMTYCFVDYDPATIHLSIIIFIHLTQLKIQFVCHATSMKKILITVFGNVLQVSP